MNNIDQIFTYHPPKPGQPEQYAKIRAAAKSFAELVTFECPVSMERHESLNKIQESVFWANAGIARHGQAVEGASAPEPSSNYGVSDDDGDLEQSGDELLEQMGCDNICPGEEIIALRKKVEWLEISLRTCRQS